MNGRARTEKLKRHFQPPAVAQIDIYGLFDWTSRRALYACKKQAHLLLTKHLDEADRLRHRDIESLLVELGVHLLRTKREAINCNVKLFRLMLESLISAPLDMLNVIATSTAGESASFAVAVSLTFVLLPTRLITNGRNRIPLRKRRDLQQAVDSIEAGFATDDMGQFSTTHSFVALTGSHLIQMFQLRQAETASLTRTKDHLAQFPKKVVRIASESRPAMW